MTHIIEQAYAGLDIDFNSPARDLIHLHEKIQRLKVYYQSNKKDYRVSRTIMKLVAKKRKTMKYIEKNNIELFKKIEKTFK